MTRGDLLFLDTNVLLSATVESRPDHQTCRELLRSATDFGVHLVTVPQVFREYLAVATRPQASNGLGLEHEDALRNINAFRTRAHLLAEARESFTELLVLIERYRITGKQIHDANLVAAMRVHRVPTLITANVQDFRVFEGIRVLEPVDGYRRLSSM
jgi:predicted nucleic acid-binding protein